MSDKDDATASLGNSEVASVQYPPGALHPDVGQVCEDPGEVASCLVRDGEKARDVLADEPCRA
jgi:hypothetical protein